MDISHPSRRRIFWRAARPKPNLNIATNNTNNNTNNSSSPTQYGREFLSSSSGELQSAAAAAVHETKRMRSMVAHHRSSSTSMLVTSNKSSWHGVNLPQLKSPPQAKNKFSFTRGGNEFSDVCTCGLLSSLPFHPIAFSKSRFRRRDSVGNERVPTNVTPTPRVAKKSHSPNSSSPYAVDDEEENTKAKTQSLPSIIATLQAVKSFGRRVFQRKRSNGHFFGKSLKPSVLVSALDLCVLPNPDDIAKLIDLVDVAPFPVKAEALAILARLCTVEANALLCAACGVIDEMLLVVTAYAPGDQDHEELAALAVTVLNEVIGVVNPNDVATQDIFTKLRQTGVGVILDTLRAVMGNGFVDLRMALLRSCVLIVKLNNLGLQTHVLHGVALLPSFMSLLQPAKAGIPQLRMQTAAYGVVETLMVAGFHTHFLDVNFLHIATHNLITGLCPQRLHAIRWLRMLARSSAGAVALFAYKPFGQTSLVAMTHTACKSIRREAIEMFRDLLIPDQEIEVGSTVRAVSMLRSISPRQAAAAVAKSLMLSFQSQQHDAVLTLIKMISYMCLLEFHDGLIYGDQISLTRNRAVTIGGVLALEFQHNGACLSLTEEIKNANTSSLPYLPKLLLASCDLLLLIQQQVPKRRTVGTSHLNSNETSVHIGLVGALKRSMAIGSNDNIAAIEGIRLQVQRHPRDAMVVFNMIHDLLYDVLLDSTPGGQLQYSSIELLKLIVTSHGDVADSLYSYYGPFFFVDMLAAVDPQCEAHTPLFLSVLSITRIVANCSDSAADAMYTGGLAGALEVLTPATKEISDLIAMVLKLLDNCTEARKDATKRRLSLTTAATDTTTLHTTTTRAFSRTQTHTHTQRRRSSTHVYGQPRRKISGKLPPVRADDKMTQSEKMRRTLEKLELQEATLNS